MDDKINFNNCIEYRVRGNLYSMCNEILYKLTKRLYICPNCKRTYEHINDDIKYYDPEFVCMLGDGNYYFSMPLEIFKTKTNERYHNLPNEI